MMFVRALLALVFASIAPTIGLAQNPSSNCYSNTTYSSGTVVNEANSILGASGFRCSLPNTTNGSSRWDTRAFVGLAVSFGTGDYSPKGGVHLTAGVRRTNVSADNSVYGAELHGSVNLLEWKDIQLRALGLFGNRDVLGNAGLGFDIFKLTPLAVAGVQIPYGRAFVDLYAFNWNVRGFAEANTYGRIKPVSRVPACESGSTLSNQQQASDTVNATAASRNWMYSFVGGILTGAYYGLQVDQGPINGLPSSNWVNSLTCFGKTAPEDFAQP